MPTASASDSRNRRSRAACTQCRRAKVKCGLGAVPCARCQRLGLDCVWDPGFRRVRNQDRVSQLERQVQDLHERQGFQATTGDIATRATPTEPGVEPPRSSQDHASRTTTASNAVGSLVTPHSDASYYRAGDISLSQVDANDLFRIYFSTFHPHAPFLEEKTPDEYRDCSELLFWAIAAVASRASHVGPRIQSGLAAYLRDGVNSLVLGQAHMHFRLAHVQVLLLLSLWPPDNVTFWADRSWNIVNLALSLAMHIGLHNPGFEQEYCRVKTAVSDRDCTERTRTWAYCVALAQNLSMDLGIPSPLPFDNWKIQELCEAAEDLSTPEPPGIPKHILHYLMIQRMGYSWLCSLPHCASQAFNDQDLPLVLKEAEEAFCRLENMTGISLLNKLRKMNVFLHVQCMYFQLSRSDASRKAGILRAFNTAKSILSLAVSGDNCNEVMRYSPRTTLRILFQAACTMFRVVHSNYGAEIDYDSCKILAGAAQMCIRLQAALPHLQGKDFPDRCADMYQGLWNMYKNNASAPTDEPMLAVRTRLGASVIFHCLAVFFDRIKHIERRQTLEENEFNGIGDYTSQAFLWDSLSDFNWDFGSEFFNTSMFMDDAAQPSSFDGTI